MAPRHTVSPQGTTEEDTARKTSRKKTLRDRIGRIHVESRAGGSRETTLEEAEAGRDQEESQKMDICASQD